MSSVISIRKFAVSLAMFAVIALGSAAVANADEAVINVPNSGLSGTPGPYATVTYVLNGNNIDVTVTMFPGFEAFGDARRQFDVRFYLVAILFIIFDLEVAFLFPWAITLGQIGLLGFWSMVVFLGILTVGFIYEWRKGALEWE